MNWIDVNTVWQPSVGCHHEGAGHENAIFWLQSLHDVLVQIHVLFVTITQFEEKGGPWPWACFLCWN
jgi:hypothetical protein